MPASRRQSEPEASESQKPDEPPMNRAERRARGKKKNGAPSTTNPFHVHENPAAAPRRWEMRRHG
jgi:hypothetical protein